MALKIPLSFFRFQSMDDCIFHERLNHQLGDQEFLGILFDIPNHDKLIVKAELLDVQVVFHIS